jgi:serine protease inhibitor
MAELTPTLAAEGVTRAAPPTDAPVEEIAAGVTRLGYELLSGSGNRVLSALSVAYAFGMVRAGASGETAAEIDQVFGFPAAGTHAAFNAVTAGAAGPVRVANGLFPQHGLPVGAAFLTTLATHYGTGVHPVDFTGDAAEVINDWVRHQTAGRIPMLFDRLPSSTRLVLANTIHLKAEWRHPFAVLPTTEDPFTLAGGEVVRVPTMHLHADLRYAAGPGWQAVELPYRDVDLAMRVLVPDSLAPQTLLAPDVLAAVEAALRPEYVDVSLPRFDFASSIDLAETLPPLGLRRVFRPDAELGGISPGLHVDQAVQRASITVDEWGTEAAAATGLAMLVSYRPPPVTAVRADRPFAFVIAHRGTPLFTGTVSVIEASPKS